MSNNLEDQGALMVEGEDDEEEEEFEEEELNQDNQPTQGEVMEGEQEEEEEEDDDDGDTPNNTSNDSKPENDVTKQQKTTEQQQHKQPSGNQIHQHRISSNIKQRRENQQDALVRVKRSLTSFVGKIRGGSETASKTPAHLRELHERNIAMKKTLYNKCNEAFGQIENELGLLHNSFSKTMKVGQGASEDMRSFAFNLEELNGKLSNTSFA